jgi:acyl carrier protein
VSVTKIFLTGVPSTCTVVRRSTPHTLQTVSQRQQIEAAVYGILAARWPGRFRGDQLADEVSLGEGGLGLDSIEIVELLLECEERVGYVNGNGSSQEVLDAGPITIGRLIDHVSPR